MLAINSTAQQRIVNLETRWRFNLGDRMEWANPSLDDTRWELIDVPSTWEDQGFHGYDGYAWYRFTFDAANLSKDVNYVLNLGYIDDACQIFVNGQIIGFNGNFPPDFYTAYNAMNEFPIPKNLIKPNSKNVIAVRVFDITLGGGIVSGKPGIYSSNYSNDMINLEGIWKFTTERDDNWAAPRLDDSDWGLIMVPGYRKSKHIKEYVNYMWYRKSFWVTKEMLKKDYTIVLGYVDDFDTSMLNGVFIGRTYDGNRLGKSNSWRELRIYDLPKGLLKEGENVLAVQVKDLGIDAGIYRGPVALIETDLVTSLLRKRD